MNPKKGEIKVLLKMRKNLSKIPLESVHQYSTYTKDFGHLRIYPPRILLGSVGRPSSVDQTPPQNCKASWYHWYYKTS